ncbi:MAG: hypothetical protein ACXIVQ_05250 [Acidimicrobiales bacterium]
MSARASDLGPEPDQSVESLVGRIAELEALLEARSSGAAAESNGTSSGAASGPPAGERKPKGGPISDDTRRVLVAKRERLELARLAEQAAWDDLKIAVREAAESGVSYREIGDTIGVTRARVYQIVSGKR